MTNEIVHNVVIIAFCLCMIANLIAFIRHWRMMQALKHALNGMVESQRIFERFMTEQTKSPSIDP